MMRTACMSFLVPLFALVYTVSAPAVAADRSAMFGFTPQAAGKQRRLEKKFDSLLDKSDLKHWLKQMSSQPNNVGSPHDKANAMMVLKLFESWGYDAKLAKYKILYPTPKVRKLDLVSPTHYKAKLREPPVKGDPSSHIYKNALPPENVYSADGDVTAGLIYVNYGLPDDYKELARRGIGVKGKIVIARYGKSWRGIKPRLAYRHGAVGCILYSDPADDGYGRGDVYPNGGWRNKWGAQRGSVENMTLYPGDPLTPGRPSIPGVKRLSVKDSPVIKKIPVLPIAWGDALPLLRALGGPAAPASWSGGLPITYHIGPGKAKVHFKLAFNWDQATAYDVIAKIPGSQYPNQWVMRGNHRDGWVFGASDPLSSHVSMLEEAKAVGALLKTGWRPKRTIVYMSWDAEEPGTIGSTEWVEQHAKQLKHNGVLYINTDGNGRGFLGAGGSGSLQRAITQVGRSVTDPETGVSVTHRARAAGVARQLKHSADRPSDKVSPDPNQPLPIRALGSGSDFVSFLDRVGVPSMSMGFYGEGEGTQYHSRYDTFTWYSRFGDPTFKYGIALAKVGGRLMLRFADAQVLPYTFTGFADHVADYADEIEKLHDSMHKKTARHNAAVHANDFKLAADPTRPYVAPKAKASVPALDFKPLDRAVARLKSTAAAYDAAYDAALKAHADKLSASEREHLDTQLIATERQLLYSGGLPHRKWYKHMIYAPGYYTGYGVKTLPGIREAVEQRHWDTAKKYIGIVAGVLNDFSHRLEQATQTLQIDR